MTDTESVAKSVAVIHGLTPAGDYLVLPWGGGVGVGNQTGGLV